MTLKREYYEIRLLIQEIEENVHTKKRALRKRHSNYELERFRTYYKTRKKNEIIQQGHAKYCH